MMKLWTGCYTVINDNEERISSDDVQEWCDVLWSTWTVCDWVNCGVSNWHRWWQLTNQWDSDRYDEASWFLHTLVGTKKNQAGSWHRSWWFLVSWSLCKPEGCGLRCNSYQARQNKVYKIYLMKCLLLSMLMMWLIIVDIFCSLKLMISI